jgi:hypothetical protein
MNTRNQLRRHHLHDAEAGHHHEDVAALTPAERIGMMWQLALDAWAFKGDTQHAQSRLQRHVVRIHRRGS